MQDEIVARLSNSLNTQLKTAKRVAPSARRTGLMDLYFQGMAWLNKGLTPENLSRAENYLEKALSLDSNNVEALVGMALVNSLRPARNVGRSPLSQAASRSVCDRAFSLAPDDRWGAHASVSPTCINRAAKASRNANGAGH